MSLGEGWTFAGHTIVRRLGPGGLGEVYCRVTGREMPKHQIRFDREADLASTLCHPHIVGVHDRGEFDGQLWISMDFVDGLDAARLRAAVTGSPFAASASGGSAV